MRLEGAVQRQTEELNMQQAKFFADRVSGFQT
jgi:hypothetical protein